MSTSILNSIISMFDTHEISNLAGRFGEPEQAISSGIASSVAAMIGGLAKKTEDPSSMRQLFDLVSSAPADLSFSDVAGGAFSSGGGRLRSMIFGDKQDAVSDVAATSGLSASTVKQLMGLAAPLLLSVLGRRVRESALTPNSLRGDLVREAGSLGNLLPTEFSTLSSASPAAAATVATTARAGSSWRWPVLAIIVGLLGIFWLANRVGNRGPDVATLGVAAGPIGDEMRARAAGLGDLISRKLPNNSDLRIPERGVEARLLSFIQSSASVSNDSWFDFDRLQFGTGSATLRRESQEQLQNIGAIMEAYPDVSIKIGGYTDNAGSPDANLQLSRARANEVLAELARLGVSSNRMQAEGYGEQHPVADNMTEEGRAKNRRISMRVIQK